MPSDARIPVIVGPTAGGKSDLAVRMALDVINAGGRACILAADAFQVYRGMDIGTAKPTPDERKGVEHLLIDLVEPAEAFAASRWLKLAEETIARKQAQGESPIVVGGTHLYVQLLTQGMFEGPGADATLREELSAMHPDALRQELQRVDPASAAWIHPSDIRRTVRALEVFRITGSPVSVLRSQWETQEGARRRERFRLIGLHWPVEAINRRINARVKQMMDRGLLDEVRSLHERRALGPTAREALGYKQLVMHLEGRCSLSDAVEQIKIQTRRFAKNQRTWLKRLRVDEWREGTEAP